MLTTLCLVFAIFAGTCLGAVEIPNIKLYPEEQVLSERCMDACHANECGKDFYKIFAKDKDKDCNIFCRVYLNCNDLAAALTQHHDDRKNLYGAKFGKDDMNENFSALCNQRCEKVTGEEPAPGAVGVASIKMGKEECKIRCKIASYT